MATTTSQLSWKEFERLPDDAMHREILEGELITLPPPKSGHSKVAASLYDLLAPFVKKHKLGSAFVEAGYKLTENPPTWIQPDVSFLSKERVDSTDADGYFLGAPELAVEIVSPSESARDLERKVEALLAGGALAIWVIYPEARHVRVYAPDGTSVLRISGHTLTLPEIFAGFELPVSAIFTD